MTNTEDQIPGDRFFPVFEQQPDDQYVEGWRGHIAETGRPETYDNVSSTKPEQVNNIVLLSEEISVPTALRPGGEMIPCPFCSASAPKFKRGRMAYFPDERATRFIGPRCAQTHFGDSYATAERLYRRQQQCREYIGLWEDVARQREAIQSVFAALASLASDLQYVRDALDEQASGFCKFLHRELAQTKGELKVKEDLGMKDHNGGAVIQERVIGKVSGLRFLSPDFATEGTVRRFRTMLEETASPLPEWQPASPEHPATPEILRLGKAASTAFKKLIELHDELEDGRRFLEPKNIGLIQQWGTSPLSSPFAVFEFRRAGKQLLVRSKTFAGDHYANVIVPAGAQTKAPPVADLLRRAA